MHAAIHTANRALSPPGDEFDPEQMLADTAEATTVLEAASSLGLFAAIDPEHGDAFKSLLADLPPSLDAAILVAVRSALGRGVRTQIVWQPAVGYEVRMWEASAGSHGALTVHLLSPDPMEGPVTQS
jgi:hypothetical protein